MHTIPIRDKTTHEFSVPVSFREFKKEYRVIANKPGIYIWGFMDDFGFVPYYVGRRISSVYARVTDHMKKIRKGGTYMIFDEAFYDSKNIRDNMGKVQSCPKPYKQLGDLKNWEEHYLDK